MTLKQKLALGVALLCALLLLLGALVLPWWTGELARGRFAIDLRSMEMCLDTGCGAAKALSAVGEDARGWARLGSSTFAASLVAAALLIASAIAVLRGSKQRTVHWLAMALSFFSGVLAILFLLLRPEFGEWTPTYGLASTLAGAFAGATAASVLLRTQQKS